MHKGALAVASGALIKIRKLVRVIKQLSDNEVSGVRQQSENCHASEVAVYMSGEFGLAGGGEEHVED